MLPYVRIDDLHLAFLTIHPFGILVALAVIVGTALAKRRARAAGLDEKELDSFIGWMLLAGFASAHALDEILYRPHEALAHPWTLLYFWDGIGSFSGWLGALAGVVAWRHLRWEGRRIVRRTKPQPILPFADVILSVFPIAWIFGRTGCAVVHDHPGVAAANADPLAVAFPAASPAIGDGPGTHHILGPITVIQGHFPRYDLGLLELLFTIVLALVFVVLWRRRLVTGTYAAIACLAYAPVRLVMDSLRVVDARYAGLTPAQWLCLAMFAFGIALAWRIRRASLTAKAT